MAGRQPHRDRTHRDHAGRYADLKRHLAPLLETDRAAYVAGHADLIADFLRQARGPRPDFLGRRSGREPVSRISACVPVSPPGPYLRLARRWRY